MRLLLGILLLYYICMVCVTIVTMYKRKYKEYIITKTLASTGFMLIGIAVSMSYYQPLLLAFLCCFAGDVLLALSNEIVSGKPIVVCNFLAARSWRHNLCL